MTILLFSGGFAERAGGQGTGHRHGRAGPQRGDL